VFIESVETVLSLVLRIFKAYVLPVHVIRQSYLFLTTLEKYVTPGAPNQKHAPKLLTAKGIPLTTPGTTVPFAA